MLQGLLDTRSLTGGQWVIVLALSLITPAFVGIDKAIQMSRQASNKVGPGRTPQLAGR
jgi:Ca2+-transporting ATPase